MSLQLVIYHTSFNPDVLETNKINSAVLIDPICIPTLSPTGFNTRDIYIEYPVQIFYAEKLLDTDAPLPDWQRPNFYGDIRTEIVKDVGHPDILDNYWADIAKRLNLWGTAENELVDFNEWKLKKTNSIKQTRMEYRKLVANRCIEFIGEIFKMDCTVYNIVYILVYNCLYQLLPVPCRE